MLKTFHDNKVFENTDYTEQEVKGSEYSDCRFVNCNFTKANLSDNDFIDCEFKDCTLSMTKLTNSGIKNVKFLGCKVLGIDFSVCKSLLFAVGFNNCILDYSTFFKTNLKKTVFKDSSLKEADFEEADLSSAIFTNCDMAGAKFVHTNLEKADLRTSKNIFLDPEQNKLKKAKFSHQEALGLLAKYDIEIE